MNSDHYFVCKENNSDRHKQNNILGFYISNFVNIRNYIYNIRTNKYSPFAFFIIVSTNGHKKAVSYKHIYVHIPIFIPILINTYVYIYYISE